MAQAVCKPICKWMSLYLCMRDSPKIDQVHPDSQTFDAIIVWRGVESPKEKKAGGISYEVILKPASADNPPRPLSPPKERPVSQEFIEKKLRDAEERRQSVEAAKLQIVAKTQERIVEANQRVASLNESFSKEAEKKLAEKMEKLQENKNAQLRQLQDRLKDHAQRVEEVRKTGDRYVMELKERIDRKMETMQGNRQAQLKVTQERIREHEKQIQKALGEVQQSTDKFSKVTEEKLLQKMETSMKNREDQLQQLIERLQDHERRIQEVRKNKEMNQSMTDEVEETS